MQSLSELVCAFTTRVFKQDEDLVVTIPKSECRMNNISSGDTVKVVLLDQENTNNPVAKEDTSTPVSEGDVLDVDVISVGNKGDGVAKIASGFVIFIPGGNVGETVTVEITEVAGSYAKAEKQ